VLVCHNCSEGYHNSIPDEAVSDVGYEDDPDDLDQRSVLSPPHSSATGGGYESDEVPREEDGSLSELVVQAIFPTPQVAKLEFEGNKKDFPVFEADDLSNSFEDIIEDFLDALASAPNEPAVLDLNKESIVEDDHSFFLHEISHDVFTFGIAEKDRETVPILQDGGVHGKEEEEPEERLSVHFMFYLEPINEQPPPEISEPASVVLLLVLIRDI
jgi:hypothetical protein